MSESLEFTMTETTPPLSFRVTRAVARWPDDPTGVSQARLILFSKSRFAVDAIRFDSAFFCAASSAACFAAEALASASALAFASASALRLASASAFALASASALRLASASAFALAAASA